MPHRRAGRAAGLVSIGFLLVPLFAHALHRAGAEADFEVRRTDPATLRTAAGQWRFDRDDPRILDFRSRYGSRWRVRWNELTGTPHRALGGAIAPRAWEETSAHPGQVGVPLHASDIASLSESFVREHAALLGVEWEDLQPLLLEFRGGRWVVTFQQSARGLEVVGGRVDLRFSTRGELLLFGSDAYPTPPAWPAQEIGVAAAPRFAMQGMPSDAVPHAAQAEKVYLPMLGEAPVLPGAGKAQRPQAPSVRLRPAYRLRLKTLDPPGNWLTHVDAETGDVLWRNNEVRFATGSVQGDVHPEIGTASPMPLPFRDTWILAGSVTDTLEAFDFETGTSGWSAETPWALSNESVHSGTLAWSDSPGVNYGDYRNLSLTSPKLHLSSAENLALVFWTRLQLEDTWDFLYVEGSEDNGSSWKTLLALSGTAAWHERRVDLSSFAEANNLRLRFRLSTDGAVNNVGCWVDDVVIARLGSAVSDAEGRFDVVPTGSDSTLSLEMRGPFAQVFNRASGGNSASLTVPAAAGTTLLNWTSAHSRANERDTFYGLNIAHARIQAIEPAFTALDRPFPVFVGIPLCNAYYGGWQIVMGAGATDCADLGRWPSIVYHEYAHAITDKVYGVAGNPPGNMHEAFSDYFAATISGDPRIGLDVLGPGTMFRSIDNKLRTPEDYSGEIHIDGTILAGALWDMRQRLLPDVALADSLFHFARYGAPKSFEDYFLEILTVDDDDGNLGNGTPHLEAIRSAFGRHGIGWGPEFEQVSVHVQDQTANGDGRLDPGESASLLLTIRNYGGLEENVSLHLSTAVPGVTIEKDSVHVGSVAAGAEITALESFEVALDETVPMGTAVVFDVEIRSSLGSNGDCFMLPAGYVPVLLVDDDRTMRYDTWITESLERLGWRYTRWEAGILGSPSAEMMASYRAVLWCTGNDRRNTLTPGDQEELAVYLGGGGRLFLTGEDIGEDLWKGNSGVPTAADRAFYENWLRAKVNVENEGAPSVTGEATDPVVAGVSFTLNGGSSANNLNSCSSLTEHNGSVAAMRYANGRVAALRYEGLYKLLYCGFGFEGISTASQRDTMLARVVRWMCPAESAPPTVSLFQPNGGELLLGSQSYSIRWEAQDSIAVVAVNLLVSTDGGRSFETLAQGIPNRGFHDWTVGTTSSDSCVVRVEALDPSGNVGLDTSDAWFSITSVTDVAAEVPRRFALYPAVPNPFNPYTALRFDLPVASPVWLQIVAVDGRRVRTLLRGDVLPAGRLQRLWNGLDERGIPAPSGVYFVYLQAGSFQSSRKIQLLR